MKAHDNPETSTTELLYSQQLYNEIEDIIIKHSYESNPFKRIREFIAKGGSLFIPIPEKNHQTAFDLLGKPADGIFSVTPTSSKSWADWNEPGLEKAKQDNSVFWDFRAKLIKLIAEEAAKNKQVAINNKPIFIVVAKHSDDSSASLTQTILDDKTTPSPSRWEIHNALKASVTANAGIHDYHYISKNDAVLLTHWHSPYYTIPSQDSKKLQAFIDEKSPTSFFEKIKFKSHQPKDKTLKEYLKDLEKNEMEGYTKVLLEKITVDTEVIKDYLIAAAERYLQDEKNTRKWINNPQNKLKRLFVQPGDRRAQDFINKLKCKDTDLLSVLTNSQFFGKVGSEEDHGFHAYIANGLKNYYTHSDGMEAPNAFSPKLLMKTLREQVLQAQKPARKPSR